AFKNSLEVIREPITAVALLGVAFYHDWQLTLVIFATAPFFLATFTLSGKRIRKYVVKAQADNAEMLHTVTEGLGGQKIIKAFGLQDYILSRFGHSQARFLKNRRKSNSAEERSHPLVELIGSFAFAGVIMFAHKRIS